MIHADSQSVNMLVTLYRNRNGIEYRPISWNAYVFKLCNRNGTGSEPAGPGLHLSQTRTLPLYNFYRALNEPTRHARAHTDLAEQITIFGPRLEVFEIMPGDFARGCDVQAKCA